MISDGAGLGVLLFCAAMAFLLGVGLTPVAGRLARRLGAMDAPNPTKIHRRATPRLGGVSIVGGTLTSLAALGVVFPGLYSDSNWSVGIALCGAIACGALGATEDIRGLAPWTRFGAEAVIAALVVGIGVRVGGLAPAVALVLSWAFIIGTANGVNLIDGLDGLAAGSCTIAGVAISAMAFRADNPPVGYVAAIIAASCLGFLLHSFHPARIFMGDSGSLFLGASLAALALAVGTKPGGLPKFLGAVVVLGLPVSDIVLAFGRRSLQRKSVVLPDRGHFYDQLMVRCGLSHRSTVLFSYSMAALLAIIGVLIANASLAVALTVAVGLFVLALVLMVAFRMLTYAG